ncbi:hypothetical protein [Spirosoma validum]|nr:hypothetical protein [Spirosoma validum]
MKSIVDALDHPDWKIQGWQIKFLLSERLLHEIKKISRVSNWYEDPVIADTWTNKLFICFNSIQNYYKVFGVLPQVGDRLFSEESGLIVQERSIDGNVMTITFTLAS